MYLAGHLAVPGNTTLTASAVAAWITTNSARVLDGFTSHLDALLAADAIDHATHESLSVHASGILAALATLTLPAPEKEPHQ